MPNAARGHNGCNVTHLPSQRHPDHDGRHPCVGKRVVLRSATHPASLSYMDDPGSDFSLRPAAHQNVKLR